MTARNKKQADSLSLFTSLCYFYYCAGPNEEICYVSRKIFPKQVACQPSRKRQLSPDAKAAAADLWRQQGPHKQRYMPITPDHAAPLCRPALISPASPFGR